MIKLLNYNIDVNGDEDDYSGEYALERITDMYWDAYCPAMNSDFRSEFPEEYMYDIGGNRIWRSNCPRFSQEGKDYVVRVFKENKMPIDSDYLRSTLNDGGCSECWTHTYYLTLARFMENDVFWRVKWEEHLSKKK